MIELIKTRKTHEEFIKELKEVNPYNITAVGKYKGAMKKIEMHCNVCNFSWETTPNSLLSKKTGCPKCNGTYKRTHDEFVKEMKVINPNITIIGEFGGTSNKIKVKCNICGNVWNTYSGSLLKGHGCKICSSPIKKSHEEFIQETTENNPYVKILGKYISNSHKVLTKCLLCGEEYLGQPTGLASGAIHYKCAKKLYPPIPKRKSHEQFIAEVEKIGKPIEILSVYKTQKDKIHVRCKMCGKERFILPSTLLLKNGTGCPDCSAKNAGFNIRKSHSEFVEEANNLNPHISIVSTYTSQKDKVLVKCLNCGHEKWMSPDKLLSRVYSCPICADTTSFPNRLMNSILYENNIEFEAEKIFSWSDGKRYDFYIDYSFTIIEMNGLQHYRRKGQNGSWGKTYKEIRGNDQYKKELAINNGIQNYIEIDASISTGEFIINSIKSSELNYLLTNIDISNAIYNCLFKTKIITLSELYNNGITKNVDLQKELGISKGTCTRYIKLAREAKLIS